MPDILRKIPLTFRRQDFEEIYFKNNQQSIFKSAELKHDFIIMMLFGSLGIVSLLYFLITDKYWRFPAFLLFMFVVSLIFYIIKARPVLKWKKQVVSYLNGLEKIKHHEIIITNEALTCIQDEVTTIVKWENFSKAVLNDQSITLSGVESFFFPKKAMTANDFTFLKEHIASKIQGIE